MNWSIEDIIDKDIIFYRMHKQHYEKNPETILGSGFKPRGKTMSTDWRKFSTPEGSLLRASSPNENRIVSMRVGKVRETRLIVEHSPSKRYCNRAHTNVYGLKGISRSKKNKIREFLASNSNWEPINEEIKKKIIEKNIEQIKYCKFDRSINEIMSNLKTRNFSEINTVLDDLYCDVAPLSGDRCLKESLLESIEGFSSLNLKGNSDIEEIVNKLKEFQKNCKKAKITSVKHWNALLN